jgi:hypothetical protein
VRSIKAISCHWRFLMRNSRASDGSNDHDEDGCPRKRMLSRFGQWGLSLWTKSVNSDQELITRSGYPDIARPLIV